MMTENDYHAAQEFLGKKSHGLMDHEDKPIAKTGFPVQNYTIYPIQGRIFYVAAPNVFTHIMMKNVLLEAVKKYPERFGTGDAYDVVEAIRLIEPSFDTTQRHAQFLQNEQFGFIMENNGGTIQDKVLRIDLFREIKANAGGKHDFVGGVLHALKHFSYKGSNMATGKDINDIADPEQIIGLAIKAFFIPEETEQTAKGFIGRISLDENYWLKFSFYLEPVNAVHFINTVHKEKKKKVVAVQAVSD